jgi:hypothetical protein
LKGYGKILLPVLIIINEVLKTYVLSRHCVPYQNLITGILLFIFSLNSTSYFSRALFACLYGFSFIIDVFLVPVSPYLILSANYLLVFTGLKKRDNSTLYLVISVVSFFFMTGQTEQMHWFMLVLLNLLVIFISASPVAATPVLAYNVLALMIPFITWIYNPAVFMILLAGVYVLYIKKGNDIFKHRIYLFAISFPLLLLRGNIYLSAALCLILTVCFILLNNNIEKIYNRLNDLVFDRLTSLLKVVEGFLDRALSGIVRFFKIRPDYSSVSNRAMMLINRINIDAVVVVAVFTAILLFIYRLSLFARGNL